jgi:hypothetical protein
LLASASGRVIAPQVQSDPSWRMAMPLFVMVAVFGYVPIWIACIANAIHADRLVGSTAFWLTRPISPGTLLGGKLLGLCTFVLLPSLILEAIIMAAFRVSPGVILAALLQQAWMQTILTLVIVFLSSITTTVIRVLIILAFAGTAELVWIQIMAAIVRRQLAAGGSPPVFVSFGLPFGYMDPNAMLLGGTFFAIGVSVAIAYQYRYRRRWHAVALFAAVVGATWMLQGVWNHLPLIREPSVDQEPWARDARARLRTVDVASGSPLPAKEGTFRLDDRTVIAAPVMLDGLPPGYVATPILQHAALTFDDGSHVDAITRNASNREVSIHLRVERWATLFELDNATLRQRGDRPATYTGTFDFIIERQTPIATLPAAVGATASDGARSVTVAATPYASSGCTPRLTTTAVRLVTNALEWPDLTLSYQFRDGREMIDPYAQPLNNPRMFNGPRYAVASTSGLLRGFDLNVRTAYPTLKAVNADCHDIIMHVARVSYAGHLTRTLELRNFHLNDPFSTR